MIEEITFKPKGHKKVTVTLSSSFELKKCKLRKPTNKHKYDYIITVNSVDYKLYAKTYKRIMRQLTQFNSNYTSKEFSQANDNLYSSIYVTESIEPDNDFSHYSSRFSIMYAWSKTNGI